MVDGVSFVFAVLLNFFVYLSVALLEDEGHFLICSSSEMMSTKAASTDRSSWVLLYYSLLIILSSYILEFLRDW